MKKLFLLAFSFVTIILISCQKEDLKSGKKTGTLIVDIGIIIRDYEVSKGLKVSQQPEDFKVIVYRADGTQIMIFETASAMPDSIELETGQYYVEAHSNNNLPAAFENPYFYGVSQVFTISSNMEESVMVNCGLANTIVSVVYSDTLIKSFVDYSTTVSSALGTLIFTKDETRLGYFHTLPLDILVELTYMNPDGSESIKTLSGSIPEPLTGRHYEIYVNSTLDNGWAKFQIFLDETEIPVEVIEITDDSGMQQNNEIGYGELLITEIMFDPMALTDTQGEWFEIYNNSNRTVNLQNLVLVRDSTNRHTITDSFELLPGEYFVFARTEIAIDSSNNYVYGSDIVLPNTGADLAIYNKDSGTNPGELIFSINYGGENFQSIPGASIILSPDRMNATDAVSGNSWCISSSAYITGDSGTPGMVNDSCQ